MNLFPQASGIRPRLACEVSPTGVVAARAASAAAPIAAASRISLAAGALQPGLRPGNLVDRLAVIAAVRQALEAVGVRPNSRGSDLTLVIPDSAVRVLLLDFDALPNKLSEALPIVRFRLKKLLPFEADDAMISYQIMSTSRSLVRVLAVAMPRDVLAEYETAVREAGYEPGSVLPSTLACMAALPEGGADTAALIVNAQTTGVTTAIVRSGILLLHRSVDLQATAGVGTPANLPPALFERSADTADSLPLVDREDSASEWAAQQPLPEHGRSPYATGSASAEAAVQNSGSITGYPVPDIYASASAPVRASASAEPAPVSRSPLNSPTLLSDLSAEKHNAIVIAPEGMVDFAVEALHGMAPRVDPSAEAGIASEIRASQATDGPDGIAITSESMADFAADALQTLVRKNEAAAPSFNTAGSGEAAHAYDIAEAVSVAAAYFEDTLASPPTRILAAGPMGAKALGHLLHDAGVGDPRTLEVRELVETSALESGAVSSQVPRGALAGVLGGLRG